MYAKGADGDNDKRRAYTQTGKYAKSSKEDQEDWSHRFLNASCENKNKELGGGLGWSECLIESN